MNILHYALGFPPYRTGGLTKYCIDLMLYQVRVGNRVGLMWPGEINPYRKLTIKKRKNFEEITNYEIINPLPVALDEGVLDIEPYIQKGEYEIYDRFFKKAQPDILHIHTLMGLHKELVVAAKNNGIKIVFTTHDYYGLCPKVTFFKNNQLCKNDHDYKSCVRCNQSGLSQYKILLMQSPLYRILKNYPVVKSLRKYHREKFFLPNDVLETETDVIRYDKAEDYRKLREFYISILELIDIVHFNSSISKEVYMKYFTPNKSSIIPITHNDVQSRKKLKRYDDKKLKLTYLAPAKPFKGYNILKNALDELWERYNGQFELKIFSPNSNVSTYMIVKDGYKYDELEEIFEETDILIAPSMWYETFGFTVLEGLSYGVPVIVSDCVGAKDLLNNQYGYICGANKESLMGVIESVLLDRSQLVEMNKNIVEQFDLPKMSNISELLYN